MKTKIMLLGACAFFSSAAWAQDTTAPAVQPAVEAVAAPMAETAMTAVLPAGTAVLFWVDNAMATGTSGIIRTLLEFGLFTVASQ